MEDATEYLKKSKINHKILCKSIRNMESGNYIKTTLEDLKKSYDVGKKELYTPDEAEMYFFAFEYSLYDSNNNRLRKTISFILREKDRFTDGCKDDIIHISKFQIEIFKDDGLSETREYVKLLRRLVKGLR